MASSTSPRVAAGLGSRISALLGPTNTGKTHRAVERMLEHDSGMLGLPLRLLAREVYDKLTTRLGEAEVALITGEEKRVPPRARFFICTVEAMPLDLEVDFLGVDEIQLGAHPSRGHTFTDRLLYRRGRLETWFLGSPSVEHLVRELVPTAEVKRHPRLSELHHAGRVSLASLKPNTAVVAFTAARVYELAERLRRRKGGAAVVLGALSPRARNAQVAMYQSGEVSYLVATDAIGMGLNLDISHVAFADLSKFDGRGRRELELGELAQIAGRAGRHLQNGTFGTLAPAPELPFHVVQALETHRVPRERQLWWRNPELDTSSIPRLVESLRQPAPSPRLRRADQTEDQAALERLSELSLVRRAATGPDQVALLWEVAQIPDYRKILFEQHLALLSDIYEQLLTGNATLDPDWLSTRVERLNNTTGDLEALLTRMAFVRTWTYVTHRGQWVKDAGHWQARTRQIEDRLSDALHEALVLRFVDRSRSYSMAEQSEHLRGEPAATRLAPAKPQQQRLEQQRLEQQRLEQQRLEQQRLEQQRLEQQRLGQPQRSPSAASTVHSPGRAEQNIHAANPFAQLMALRAQLVGAEPPPLSTSLAERIVDAPHAAFDLTHEGVVTFEGAAVGRLSAGAELLTPELRILADLESPGQQSRALRRMLAFTRDLAAEYFGELRAAARAELGAPGRGLIYQLEQELGVVEARRAGEQLSLLPSGERARLAELGLTFGRRFVFVRQLVRPRALSHRRAWLSVTEALPELPPGSVKLPRAQAVNAQVYRRLGFPTLGPYCIRVDVYERVLARLAQARRQPTDAEAARASSEVAQWLGLKLSELRQLLPLLGHGHLIPRGTRTSSRGR